MEDIIAIRVLTKQDQQPVYFLTWGRVFDRIDPSAVIAAVRKHLHKYGIKEDSEMQLCDSLTEAAGARYFYEHFFAMTQKKIQFGPGYDVWKEKIQQDILNGEEIYFLGKPKE